MCKRSICMDTKDINSISSELQQAFSRAVHAIDKNNLEYATEILKELVLKDPGFVQAREKLRVVEKMQIKSGFFGNAISSIKVKKIVKLAQFDLFRGKYTDAMAKAEEALAINIKDLSALKILAEVGKALSALFIAIEAYELAYSFYPDNPEVIKLLAEIYRQAGRGKDELRMRQKLVSLFPDNLEYKQDSRAAGALATMEKEKLGNLDSSYRDKLKNAEESSILEQKEKIVHSIDDVRELVNNLEAQLKESPNSIPVLRDLAWAYYKAECYEKALMYFQKLQSLQDHFDLSADKALESSKLAILNKKIDSLAKESDSCTEKEKQTIAMQLEGLTTNKHNLRKEYAEKRIKLYPNDLQLHYELAIIYWEGKELDQAIEQFQIAQKHPQWSFSSQVHLGLCFYQKGHYELAIDQLSKAAKMENSTNEKELLEAIYFLGISFEKLNDIPNAKECFKKVYSVNARYRDVSEKIKLYYS